MGSSRYELRETDSGKHYFVLIAENGKTIVTSEQYESKQGAENGIESIKENASSPIVE